MGKDKTWDENATITENRDQESRDATLARIIAEAVDQDLILTSLVGWQKYLKDQGMDQQQSPHHPGRV